MSFIKFEKFSAIISFTILCPPFSLSYLSGFPQRIYWLAWWCSMGPLGSVYVYSIFPLFLKSYDFYYVIFKFTDFFFLPAHIWLWISSEFFFLISITLFFSFRIYFWFLLDFLSVYWHFHFVHTRFSWLSLHWLLVLWATLKFLSSWSAINFFRNSFYWFSFGWAMLFCSFICLVIFILVFLNTRHLSLIMY